MIEYREEKETVVRPVLNGGMFSFSFYFGRSMFGGWYLVGTIPEILRWAFVVPEIGIYLCIMESHTNVQIIADVVMVLMKIFCVIRFRTGCINAELSQLHR